MTQTMTPEFALVLGVFLGGGMGAIGLFAALAALFYLGHKHKREVQQISERATREAERHFEWGVAAGTNSIEVYTDFRGTGFFGRRLEYIVAVYDRREKRLRHLSGHRDNHELFSNLPAEVKAAIKSFMAAGVNNLALA